MPFLSMTDCCLANSLENLQMFLHEQGRFILAECVENVVLKILVFACVGGFDFFLTHQRKVCPQMLHNVQCCHREPTPPPTHTHIPFQLTRHS